MRTPNLAALGTLAITCCLAAAVHAQSAPAGTFFKCTDAKGRAVYTDTGCGSAAAVPVNPTDTANLEQRKAQNDARVERDKRLANQMESDRVGAAAAAQSLSQQHHSADSAVAGRQAAERDARNAAATSVLSPSSCQGCGSLGR